MFCKAENVKIVGVLGSGISQDLTKNCTTLLTLYNNYCYGEGTNIPHSLLFQ